MKEQDITIITPVFDRPDDLDPPAVPDGPEFFDKLRSLHGLELEDLGCLPWRAEDPLFDGGTLWLFPGSWYSSIPDGFELIDINGERESLCKGRTDNDTRFGCLAYGIIALPDG